MRTHIVLYISVCGVSAPECTESEDRCVEKKVLFGRAALKRIKKKRPHKKSTKETRFKADSNRALI